MAFHLVHENLNMAEEEKVKVAAARTTRFATVQLLVAKPAVKVVPVHQPAHIPHPSNLFLQMDCFPCAIKI
jgi:hypothetical protein